MGQPTSGEPDVSMSEFIADGRETGGTETSKYPEEEKETSIPRVAASETGRAQTNWLRPVGVWTFSHTAQVPIAETSGKASQRG